MQKLIFSFTTVVVVSILFSIEPAMAGPGGKIASAVYESFWGKVVLGLLILFFAPLIISIYLKEKRAEERARKDLRFMAAYSTHFEWLKIQARAKDCFHRVHAGWEDEDLSDVSDWMTDWYWQNQQMVHLNRWKKQGLRNVCEIDKISYIRPLLFVHRNQGQEHEESMLVLTMQATMRDYLEDRATGAVIEGSKKTKDVTRIWSFILINGQWRVSDIEESHSSLGYAKMIRELPDIEDTVLSELRA